MIFQTMWYVQPAKTQISLRIRAVWSEPLLVAWIFYDCKLLTEHNLEFLSIKGGCKGSSESTLVKMPHCWKSHVAAHFSLARTFLFEPTTSSKVWVHYSVNTIYSLDISAIGMVCFHELETFCKFLKYFLSVCAVFIHMRKFRTHPLPTVEKITRPNSALDLRRRCTSACEQSICIVQIYRNKIWLHQYYTM